jgi:hypothetical protein
MMKISEAEFSQIIGAPASLAGVDTGYRPATTEERDGFILQALNRIFDPRLGEREAAENREAFNRGWAENLKLAKTAGVTLDNLKPKYVKPYKLLRYRGEVIAPTDQLLLDRLYSAYTAALFEKYLSDKNSIYEFGCGSARYLFELATASTGPRARSSCLNWCKRPVTISTGPFLTCCTPTAASSSSRVLGSTRWARSSSSAPATSNSSTILFHSARRWCCISSRWSIFTTSRSCSTCWRSATTTTAAIFADSSGSSDAESHPVTSRSST